MTAKTSTPALPSSYLIALDRAGFTVVAYLDKAIPVSLGNGNTRMEWLPRLCIAPGSHGGYRVIEWLPLGHPANAYSFAGWLARDEDACGGMYRTVSQALGWFPWREEQRRKASA